MSDERERRRHRALADPSRARLLAELADEGPLGTQELARRTGLHVNTVRAHLGGLEDAGLVVSETGPARGRGRPPLVYRAVEDEPALGRRYRLLAEMLTVLVARVGKEATGQLVEIGEAWGHHLVESPPPFSTLSDAEALERVLELLDEIGFEPELEVKARRRRIAMRPCPFLELARDYQEVVCPLHLGLIRGALAELGAKTTASRLEPFVEPNLCLAHLARG